MAAQMEENGTPWFVADLQAREKQRNVRCRLCGETMEESLCGVCWRCKSAPDGRQMHIVDRDGIVMSWCSRHGGFVPGYCKLPHPPGQIPRNCNKFQRRALIGSPEDVIVAGYQNTTIPTREAVTRFFKQVDVHMVFFEGEVINQNPAPQ